MRGSVLEVLGVLAECFGSYRNVRKSVLKVLRVLGRVLEVLGVLGECFGGFRSVRGSILAVECFGGFRSVRENVLEVLGVFGGVF